MEVGYVSRIRCPAVLVLKRDAGSFFKGMVVEIGADVGGRILAVSIKEREDVEKALKDADHILKQELVVD